MDAGTGGKSWVWHDLQSGLWTCVAALSLSLSALVSALWLLDSGGIWGCQRTPAACSACSLLALGGCDGEPLHWGHPGLPLAFLLRPLAPLHPGKGRGGEAGAVPCSQRSLNVRCGDLVLVPQEHSLAGGSWGVTSALLGGRLDPGQVRWPALVSVLGSDIWKGFPPCWAAPGLVEGV